MPAVKVWPSQIYYRPKHGRWEGRYMFRVESYRALFKGSMGLFDRIVFATMGLVCRLLGSLRIETRVDVAAIEQGRVHHTTRVSKWGITLQRSEEWFELAAGGRTFGITGTIRTMPLWWRRVAYRDSSGEIDDDGRCARYDFAWGGARLVQRSSPEGDDLRFVQELDGCRAGFVLHKLD